ncbi:MAG: ABC transporter ATP-binding protein, partial [Candidatus Xenobia bacterium]
SVDSHTEEAILRGLTALRRGRTTIIVSHRLSALRQADRIAVMEGGVLIAVAPHEELLQSCPLYVELWEQQQLEGELERV